MNSHKLEDENDTGKEINTLIHQYDSSFARILLVARSWFHYFFFYLKTEATNMYNYRKRQGKMQTFKASRKQYNNVI